MTKKKTITLLLVLVILIAGVVCGFMVRSKIPPKVISLSQKGLPTENVNLVAHRGFSAVAPENSSAAFVEAGKAKFFAAECDIQLSKDNVWVVNHNKTIDKMTDGEGNIRDMTYDEISQYSVDGGHYSEKYTGQKLITLDDYLAICDEYEIIPQIEVKEGNYSCLADILTALDKYDMRTTAIIISFDGVILEKIRNLDENIELWYLTHEITEDQIKLARLNNYALAFNCKKYDEEILRKAQNENIKLASWTVDSIKIYEELYELGIRNFTTNRLTK
jgi:glycerophosphoryl diester phosphodiesterase